MRHGTRAAAAYIIAIVSVVLAGVVRAGLIPFVGDRYPSHFFFAAVTVTAWYGGVVPGLLATVFGLAGHWVFIVARDGLVPLHAPDIAGSITYLIVAATIVVAVASVRLSQRRREQRLNERAVMESTLRASVQLKAIIGSAIDAIITIDDQQRITLFNSGAERMFGCSAAEAVGQPLDRFVPERHRQQHAEYIREFGRTGVSARAMGQQRVLAALRADGTEFPMEAQISQIDAGGEKLYTVIIRDITERKRVEAQREQLLASEKTARLEAEKASRAKDAFLATISHELRTPLSPILAWSRMLHEGRLDPQQTRQAVEAIERNARMQAQLIEDLLDVSRIVSGKLRLDVSEVSLPSVIQAAIEIVRPAADAKGISLSAVLDTHMDLVLGDPARLQQVVWNLLSNAVKFTPKGGRVQVVLQRINSHVEIAVSDTGQGIKPDFLPHVFERFQQADSSSTRSHGGLGLGLAIVRHIVEAHGGKVHAESSGPGQGALFTVALPVTPVARTADDGQRRHPVAGGEALAPVERMLQDVRVLVVDDEPDSNEVVRTLLSACGAEVRTAASTAQALDILEKWRSDVLVTDIGMPDEDGCALVAKIRSSHGSLAGLPAIALTAYAGTQDRIRLFTAGFQMHVAKPVEPAELIAAVSNLARSARSRASHSVSDHSDQ